MNDAPFKSRLLSRKVMTDIFIHGLDSRTLESLRRAIDEGFVPSDLNLGGNDGSIAVLRLTRPFKSRLLNNPVADEETIRHVALELVRLGREVPEASWHEGAEDYAVAMVRRLVEVARDERSSDQTRAGSSARAWRGKATRRFPASTATIISR